MKNRKLSPTILCTLALSLAFIPARLSVAAQDDPDTTQATTTYPVAAPATPLLTYTVIHGDTLGSIAHKFGMTLTQLKRLNNLPETKVGVKKGQILQVVSANGYMPPKTAALTPAKKTSATDSAPLAYSMAQPVQNFDVPTASSSAEAPVASPGEYASTPSTTPTAKAKHAPVAKLVSPQELSADQARQQVTAANPRPLAGAPVIAPPANTTSTVTLLVSPSSSSKHPEQRTVVGETSATTSATPIASVPQPTLTSRTPTSVASNNRFFSAPSDDWGSRFLLQSRQLGNEGIGYDEEWRPPGENHSWAMDCSNTSRYIYKVTTGIELPRTASDQYYYLHLQGKAWDVPQNAYGWADTNYLRNNLKPGDLLFWENTYRPERQPPITHVMIFLGTNAQGQWLMAGSQSSRGGEHNRRNGGPDVYIFQPSQACGGYTTWLGMVHHKGRFCAFGRPLEADRHKLSVADD